MYKSYGKVYSLTEKEKVAMLSDKIDCFALTKDNQCNALIEKKCDGCKFYTPKNKIKDNPFYKFSWTNEEKMKRIIQRRVIKAKDIIE